MKMLTFGQSNVQKRYYKKKYPRLTIPKEGEKMSINRRQVLLVGFAGLLATRVAQATPAVVPPIWDGQKMYETLAKDGTGFSNPGKAGRPKAFVFFDTQCSDCIRLMDRLHPIMDRVEIVFFPIAYMNPHSDPQATLILTSKDPMAKLQEQHDHFKDPDFRGIRYDITTLPMDVRQKVWTNTKLHRRSGCRAVPYGVYKNSKGEYVPFDENLNTDELATLFELNN